MLNIILVGTLLLSQGTAFAKKQTRPCVSLEKIIPDSGFDAWAEQHANEAQARIEKKFEVGPGKIAGASEAAPKDPKGEYQYFWIRDNGICEREVQNRRDIVENYLKFSKSNLTTKTLTGPGEPKFRPDGSAFNEPWGRPQNDGSAYRAHRWMDEVDYQLNQKNLASAKLHYQPDLTNVSLKWDLEYMANHWHDPSFDLWEEEQGIHTHTLQIIQSALERGAALAKRFEPGGPKSGAYIKYKNESANIQKFLQDNAWDAERGHLLSTISHTGGFVHKESPLDIGTIAGVIHATQSNLVGKNVYKIADDQVMATVAKIEEKTQGLYRVNERFASADYKGAQALGRYAEDIFHGGNPWMISTQTAAEYYYRLGKELSSAKSVQISATNRAFFARLTDPALSKLTVGMTLTPDSPLYSALITALKDKGDAYMRIVRELMPEGGIPSEQIGRGFKPGDTGPWVSNYLDMTQNAGDGSAARAGGEPIGALDLTWNDASFLSALRARKELLSAMATQSALK